MTRATETRDKQQTKGKTMTNDKTTTILSRAMKITTGGGAVGWLVGVSCGMEWIAYEKADIKRMRAVLRKRVK
jgi:hypothetical protein